MLPSTFQFLVLATDITGLGGGGGGVACAMKRYLVGLFTSHSELKERPFIYRRRTWSRVSSQVFPACMWAGEARTEAILTIE